MWSGRHFCGRSWRSCIQLGCKQAATGRDAWYLKEFYVWVLMKHDQEAFMKGLSSAATILLPPPSVGDVFSFCSHRTSVANKSSPLSPPPPPPRWRETSALSLPAVLLFFAPSFTLAVTAWGLIERPNGRSWPGFMMKTRGEGGEGGGDQSGAFKFLTISVKALQDINPIRLLMCWVWGEA